MGSVLHDLRHAWRLFGRRPALTGTALVCVALGIGANAAIFSLVYTALIRPLPFAEPDRLVIISGSSLSPRLARNYDPVLWMAETGVFDQTTVMDSGGVNLAGGSAPERITAASVSSTFFDVFHVPAALGRTLQWTDEPAGARPVAVIGDGLWKRRFGGDRAVVGRVLSLNGMDYEIAGVMPAGFAFPAGVEMWIARVMPGPRSARVVVGPTELRGDRFAFTWGQVGRLKHGVTRDRAQAAVRVLQARADEDGRRRQGEHYGVGQPPVVLPLHERLIRNAKPALWLLLGAVSLVALIACANLANLLLANTAARRRELAVRAAIGASRSRLVRQVMTESLALAGAGGALGVLLAWALMPGIRHWTPASIPGASTVTLDPSLLGFAAIVTLVTGALAGLVPAWRSGAVDPHPHLADDGRMSGWRTGTLRSSLVVVEVAVALVLLTGATLLIQSLSRLTSVAPGFVTSHRLTFEVTFPPEHYRDRSAPPFEDLIRRLQLLPDADGVAIIDDLPLGQAGVGSLFPEIEGRPEPMMRTVPALRIASDYFSVMGIPVLRGRTFSAEDEREGVHALIINDGLGRMGWPGEDPLGRRVTLDGQGVQLAEVVGIVGSVHQVALDSKDDSLQMYLPGLRRTLSAAVVIRTKGDPLSIAHDVRATVAAVDPGVPVARLRALEDVVYASADTPRFRTILLSIFAGLALLLTIAGIYGVLSYLVALRTREIGVRVALGASRAAVVGMVMRQALPLILTGAVVGLAATFAIGHTLRAFLFGIEPTDPRSVSLSVGLLIVAALAACAVPALRAAAVNPVVALRVD